jgi:hypothetical protein
MKWMVVITVLWSGEVIQTFRSPEIYPSEAACIEAAGAVFHGFLSDVQYGRVKLKEPATYARSVFDLACAPLVDPAAFTTEGAR